MQNRTRNVLSVIGCIVCSLTLQDAVAETVLVSAQHSVVEANTDADGRNWLTLNVTLSNGSDQDLDGVRLLTSPEMSPTPGNESGALDVGSLPMDASVTVEWTFESMLALSDGDTLLGPVMFLGEATDANGEFVAFPVNSTAGEE